MGRFAHVAWVHSAMMDFRNVSDERAELYNRVGDPFVAIHLWSPDSPVSQRVVLPFVREFEGKLLGLTGQDGTSGSGRAAFDPRYQTQDEADIQRLLALPNETSGVQNSLPELSSLHVQMQDKAVPVARKLPRRGSQSYRFQEAVGVD